MNKDTIIKVLLAIIALMVFAWLWRIISGMLIGTLIKVRLNMIDKLQEKTLYDGQSEYYRNLQ